MNSLLDALLALQAQDDVVDGLQARLDLQHGSRRLTHSLHGIEVRHVFVVSLAMIRDSPFDFALASLIGVHTRPDLLDGPHRTLADHIKVSQSRRQGVEAGL